MPADSDSSEYIPHFIASFQALCKKAYIRSGYLTGVGYITKHPGMMNQISADGNYWYVIENASKKDIIKKSSSCLSEVLMDYTIKEVVFQMLGLKKDPDE